MDEVFRALADPSRRKLLDLLRVRDGRSLRELQVHLAMTRYGVMAHLRVLEEAGLITTRRRGREKLHFLRPEPILDLQARWFRSYGEPPPPVAASEPTGEDARHRFETYIAAPPERVWEALTDPGLTRLYYYDDAIRSTFEPGAPYSYVNPEGGVEITGTILEALPPARLRMTFEARWRADVAAEGPSEVLFEVAAGNDPARPATRLTLTHRVAAGSLVEAETAGGWPFLLAALKTLLETGRKLGF